ncbi:NADH-quinone oxidoreductase subunit J, partial [Dactylosporangium sp. NPDC050588]|uniref:NADH-quinone oxidoreductase subunit J n=1 Tax=Dactylosporangium sp. NPDC050588 TaxID=3157211 RepID=UPI0033D54D86
RRPTSPRPSPTRPARWRSRRASATRPSTPGTGAGAGLVVLFADAFHWSRVGLPAPGTAEAIGGAVFRTWVLPFELVSVLLLAALVGAIVVSRPDVSTRSRSDSRGR